MSKVDKHGQIFVSIFVSLPSSPKTYTGTKSFPSWQANQPDDLKGWVPFECDLEVSPNVSRNTYIYSFKHRDPLSNLVGKSIMLFPWVLK